MLKPKLGVTAGLVAVTIGLAPAQSWAVGTANRAWVSGHGTDQAGCGAPISPCRSLQYVHDDIVGAGGEIDILDPAGYGAITITKALSIVNDGVGTAGVQSTGLAAIDIKAGPNDAVYLRGLNIDGVSRAGTDGIAYESGAALTVANCVVRHFNLEGLIFVATSGAAKISITGTVVADNGSNGIEVIPEANAASANIIIDDDLIENNSEGMLLNSAFSTGAVDIAITRTTVSNNGYGIDLNSPNANAHTDIDLSNISLNSGDGVHVVGQAVAHVARSSVVQNGGFGVNVLTSGFGAVLTYGSNQINDNTSGNVNGAMTPFATR